MIGMNQHLPEFTYSTRVLKLTICVQEILSTPELARNLHMISTKQRIGSYVRYSRLEERIRKVKDVLSLAEQITYRRFIILAII